jgi:hypothetical protein
MTRPREADNYASRGECNSLPWNVLRARGVFGVQFILRLLSGMVSEVVTRPNLPLQVTVRSACRELEL